MIDKFRKNAFFDRLAGDWDEKVYHDPAKLELIVRLIGLKPGDTVLDVGCGTGAMVPQVLACVGETGSVVAIDYSEKMVEATEKKFPALEYPNVEFFVRDAGDVKSVPEYDAIICYSCFPHFPDQPAVVGRLAKALKPGGTLTVAHSEPREAINSVHGEGPEEVRHDYLPPAEEIGEMMEGARLTVVRRIEDDELFLVTGVRSSPIPDG